MDIWIKWCLVNIKQGLDRAVMFKNNHQAVGAPCRPLLLCVIYISSIVYNTLCILTVLFNKTIWFLAFDTLFELIIIASLLLYMYFNHFKSYCSLTSIFITTKNIYIYYNYRALWNPFYFQIPKCINQKACLINWVLQFYLYQILFSIIFWIPF